MRKMGKRIVSKWFILVLSAGFASATLGNENWPQFRGPNAAGIVSSGRALPSRLGPDQSVVWKAAIPNGVSSPCVWNDRLFFTGHNEDQQALVTVCLDSSTGELLWERRTVPPEIPSTHVANSPAAPTIATDGERIYVYFGLTGVTCFDMHGNEV